MDVRLLLVVVAGLSFCAQVAVCALAIGASLWMEAVIALLLAAFSLAKGLEWSATPNLRDSFKRPTS